LMPLLPPTALGAQNAAGSTPLHWASLNKHLSAVQALVKHTPGSGVELIDVRNAAGRTPLGEAETAGWDEGAQWMVGVMKLDDGAGGEEGDEKVEEGQEVEVEITDAEGAVARMKISGRGDGAQQGEAGVS
jgi:hypothetical protein